jgi:chitinase/poly(3-hydroxybutyrate) depolymerase
MKKLLFILLSISLQTLWGQVTQSSNIAVTSTLQNNNPRNRTFTFRLPATTPACNRPLLIVLHGDGGTGSGIMGYTGFNSIADANNLIAVYPDALTVGGTVQWNKYADNVLGFHGYGPDLNAPDDEKFISDLIDYFYKNYGIDKSKVYVTGHSGGGFMSYALTLSNQTKNKIAAIAPVAADLWADGTYATAQLASGTFVPTPIFHLHSTTDNTVSFPNISGWTWTGRIAEATCGTGNNGTHTTTVISSVIDKHTFCNSPNPVILMALKQAGLGHGWPTTANATYNGSQEIWNFVSAYSKGTYAVTPTVSPTSITINSGQSTTLTASGCGDLNVVWSSGQSGTSVSVSPTISTVYTATCRSTTTNCQVGNTSNNSTVTINTCPTTPPTPTLTASVNPISVGQSTTLTASGCSSPNTVTWNNGLGTGTTKSVSPATTTTYTATCSNGTCTSINGSITITVNELNQLPNPALVGYLHNWDDSGNGLPYVQLDNVPAAYNVINYAFGVAQSGTTDNIQLTLPTNVDANPASRTQTFISKMNILQNQGKKVLLSLGGSVAHGGVINVGTITKRDNFINSVTNLLKTYPFDGLDIDIEGGSGATSTLIFNQAGMTVNTPNSPTIDNLIYALKQIMVNYRAFRGKKMLLTFAPERHMVTGGFSQWSYTNNESNASYLPVIQALKDSLDLVHPQLYGYGSDIGKNGNEYCVGTTANALAVTEDLLLGYTLTNGGLNNQGTYNGLPASKIALGLATPCQDASHGFLTTAKIQDVVQYFRGTIAQPAAENPALCNWMTTQTAYTKFSNAVVEFRGLMTWSINYDMKATCGNNTFASTYTSLYGTFTASTNAKNFLTFSIPNQVGASVINTTNNTITVTMPSGTNLASLIPTFTLSPNCLTAKASGIANDFTSNVQYTVNHTDNSSKTWTIIVSLSTITPCPQNISINGSTNPPPFAANQEFKATDKILVGMHPQATAATAININSTNSNKLYLKAGKAVEIEKGTTIGSGAVFEAKIQGCGN